MADDRASLSADEFEPDAEEEVSRADTRGRRVKGRGATDREGARDRYEGAGGVFESLTSEGGAGPQRSVEGWIVIVTGVHEEAQEEDLRDHFGDHEIKNLHLNFDRRTGFVKGYALIEYEKQSDAEDIIRRFNNTEFKGRTIQVAWAFSRGPLKRPHRRDGGRRRRSISPRGRR